MFDWIADPNAWVALATLTALEIVLGVDNIIFISILVGRLPPERDLATQLGVSRPSVREALIALEVEGIVEVRMGSGIYVTALEPVPAARPAAGPSTARPPRSLRGDPRGLRRLSEHPVSYTHLTLPTSDLV